jgi:hypothetical protein
MPLPWCFIDSITAPEVAFRFVSSAEIDDILLVKTHLDSFLSVCVRFLDASANAGFSASPEADGDGTGLGVSHS